MLTLPSIIPAKYSLVLIPAVAVIVWLAFNVSKRAKARRPESHVAPLLRLYETRLQVVGAGNAAQVQRLIDAELKRRPHITRVEAARRAYNRFKATRRSAWGQHNAY